MQIKDTVCELKKIIGEYSFYLEEISDVKIRVKLYQYIGTNDTNVHFETSHYIQTPIQCGPYLTSRTSEINAEIALWRATSTITDFYESAIREGHVPDKSWLVKNEDF